MGVEAVWEEALAYIEAKVPKPVFETWFIPLHFNGMDDLSARVEVPNKFFGEWLDQHHRGLISEALAVAYGREERDIAVEFITTPKVSEKPATMPEPQSEGRSTPASRQRRVVHLNPKYTFKSFVVGASNQFAHGITPAFPTVSASQHVPEKFRVNQEQIDDHLHVLTNTNRSPDRNSAEAHRSGIDDQGGGKNWGQ